jgi:hypothetical protein
MPSSRRKSTALDFFQVCPVEKDLHRYLAWLETCLELVGGLPRIPTDREWECAR